MRITNDPRERPERDSGKEHHSQIIVFPLLTVIADVTGIFGGLLVATAQFRLDSMLYWNTIFDLTSFRDYFCGFAKSVVFGFLIALAGCYQGLSSTGAAPSSGTRPRRRSWPSGSPSS